MIPTNKEMQQLQTCQLYAYVLRFQNKEVCDEVQSCANSYDYLIDCVEKLYNELQSLNKEMFEQIVHNDSVESNNLARWYQMHQESQELYKMLSSL